MTAFMYFGCNVTFASLPVFLPTIINEMGSFSSVQSNGLSAPPYVLCFLVIITCAFLSDKLRNRGFFVAANAFIAAIGFLIMAVTTKTAVRYFSLFLCVLIFVSVAIILAWVTNNSGTDSKRAGGLWILSTVGQCGPILGTRVFPANGGPYYRKGMWICCGFCFFVFGLATTLSLLLRRENKRRDSVYGKGTGVDAFDESVDAGALGDDAPTFRYVC
jgi:predicted MFS family arabinose efflux permease